ncbi:hypothetical protein WG66_003444 [Moniliophthora roreri]|nr:hypothetical protein WG66_003444 [Moniliophthora roreri]
MSWSGCKGFWLTGLVPERKNSIYDYRPVSVDEDVHKVCVSVFVSFYCAETLPRTATSTLHTQRVYILSSLLISYRLPSYMLMQCKTHGTLGGWGQRDVGRRVKGFSVYDDGVWWVYPTFRTWVTIVF